MTRHVLASIVLLFSVLGCGRNAAPPPGLTPGAEPKGGASAGVNRYLAYEHTIGIETGADKIAPLFDAVQSACLAAVTESCAILEARITKGEYASASLKFRAKASGIRKLVEVLSAQGEVESQSTTAEDLAGPIEDNAKRIAMLTDYRTKLEALRNRGTADMDTLIKLTRELAQVQSEIEALTGSQAQLVQRVETEILNVSIRSSNRPSFMSPIAEAASDFGGNLSEAIGVVIIVVAFLLPWSLVVALGIWIWRKLRRRRKQAQAGA